MNVSFYKSTQYHDMSFNFRLYDECRGVFVQDCDDDGETAAGGRLLHLLQVSSNECIYKMPVIDINFLLSFRLWMSEM